MTNEDVCVYFREYNDAYTIASEAAPELLPEVRQQRAGTLAQTGRHADAEKEFLAAGQADQAVQMYEFFSINSNNNDEYNTILSDLTTANLFTFPLKYCIHQISDLRR